MPVVPFSGDSVSQEFFPAGGAGCRSPAASMPAPFQWDKDALGETGFLTNLQPTFRSPN